MSEATNEIGKIYQRPWGTYQTIALDQGYQVKIISVNPGAKLSLQKHAQRAEHWVVVQGIATVTVDCITQDYNVNQAIYIPQQAKHRLENRTEQLISVIEVQVGSYLGEDDIVRYDDVYGRN